MPQTNSEGILKSLDQHQAPRCERSCTQSLTCYATFKGHHSRFQPAAFLMSPPSLSFDIRANSCKFVKYSISMRIVRMKEILSMS